MYLLALKIALRNLWKNKGFSLINIGGLAIGLTCCLVLLLYVNYEWSYDKQFKNIGRIYSVYDNDIMSDRIITNRAYCTPNQLATTIMQTVPGVEQVSRMAERDESPFRYKHNAFNKNLIFADPSFLKIFDYNFIKGDSSNALSTPNSAIITEQTAKILFGEEDPIGKVIRYDNRSDLMVTAVIANHAQNQTYRFDVLIPWAFLENESPWYKKMGWTDGALNTIVMLKDAQQFASADQQVRKIFKQNTNDSYIEFFLFPLKKNHLYDQFENGELSGGRIDQIKLFLLLAVCVLFIACINYMNLSTARSEKRAKEIGIRKTLGSSRQSIAWQFILESLLLSFMALLIAFILLETVLPYFNNLLAIDLTIDYGSYEVWAILIGLTLITGLLAGSYPALYLSSLIPLKILKGIKGAGKTSLPIRKILVVIQFGFSICMIICAIVVRNQISYMNNRPLGFNKDNLVQIGRLGVLRDSGKLQLFKSELIKSGAIVSATETTNGLTNNYVSTEKIKWPGQLKNEQVAMQLRFSGYDFTKTIDAKILQGRDFSREFGNDTTKVILNETAVKTMNLKDPIGAKIKNDDWNETFTVIGVMKDYNYSSLGTKVSPLLFFYSETSPGTIIMRLNPSQSITTSTQKIKELSLKLNPDYPFQIDFVSERIADKLKSEKLLSIFSNAFGGFAIFISCLGLLGLALYIAEQRSKEISIRKVIGANLKDILILLNKDFIKLVILSNMIAIPAAYIITTSWLQKYDYKIGLNIWPFITAFVLSIFIAVLTVSLQTFKVARANPVDALKYD